MYNRTGRARVDSVAPRAFAVCDKCGMLYNHRNLVWDVQWQGPRLLNRKFMVCDSCQDTPQEQLRTMVIPADPIPIYEPRPEQYPVEVDSYLSAQSFAELITESGINLVTEIEDTPNPDPDNPADYP